MNTYSIALFLHIVGALGFFVALSLEWTALRQIRNAMTSDQVHAWMPILGSTRRMGIASMLMAVISGFYMMMTTWGHVAWIVVTLLALVLVVVLAMALTGPRMAPIGQGLSTEKGELSRTFHDLANNPLLWISIQVRVAIALGIVFLMTVKPGLIGSLLTISVAIVLGLASALSSPRRERVRESQAEMR